MFARLWPKEKWRSHKWNTAYSETLHKAYAKLTGSLQEFCRIDPVKLQPQMRLSRKP
jgi:hypothetical protein